VEVLTVDDTVAGRIMDDVVIGPRAAHDASRDEFRGVFAAVYPRVVRTAYFIVHDESVAEEIAQDAFVELYRGWSKIRTYERPDLWVRRVAIRKAQREDSRSVRRIGLERAVARPDRTDDGADAPDPELMAAIRTLPAQQRAVLVLFYLEDLPMAEVADLVGCSTSTGFVHLHRARCRLAELLSEEVDGHVR
jgi:RNA polymerase sigma-70 factor (ECF subfamily)